MPSPCDASRSRRNLNIIRDQRRRFLKKQTRGKKSYNRSDPYSSGKYSGAMSNIPSNSSAEEVIDLVFPAASPSASSSEDFCKVCNGTEDNRLVGVGLGLRIVDEEVAGFSATSVTAGTIYFV